MNAQWEFHPASCYFLPLVSWHWMECECGQDGGEVIEIGWLCWSLQIFLGGDHEHP